MDVDDAIAVAPKGTGADFVAIDEETKKQTRDPLSVKVKPKRGKSSRKQKQRLAIKLDKALATSDRSAAKSQKKSHQSTQRQSLKHLWSSKDKPPTLKN